MINAEAKVRGDLTQQASERDTETEQSWRERISLFLSRAIFVAVLAVIGLTAVPYGTVEPWWEAIFECFVFSLGALWIIEGGLRGTWVDREHRLLLPIIILLAFAFLQTMHLWRGSGGGAMPEALSADPYGTRLVALKLLAYALCLTLLIRYTKNMHRLRALVYLVIGIAVASALFGIVRQTVQREPGFILPYLLPGSGYGQFINYNHFAFLMEMGLGLTLGLIVGRGVRRDHMLIYFALAIPIGTALILANSRGGIFSMISQIIFIVLMLPSVHPAKGTASPESRIVGQVLRVINSFVVRVVIMVCLVIALIVTMVWLGGDRLANRMQSVSGEFKAESTKGNEGDVRLEIWRMTWQLIKEHPITGVGFGSYWVEISRYHQKSGRMKPYAAHNDYLELLASGGVIGVVLAGWFSLWVILRARQRLRAVDPFRRAACFGALTGLFGVAVHSLVDFGLQITINALVFITLIVIATLNVPVSDKQLQE